MRWPLFSKVDASADKVTHPGYFGTLSSSMVVVVPLEKLCLGASVAH